MYLYKQNKRVLDLEIFCTEIRAFELAGRFAEPKTVGLSRDYPRTNIYLRARFSICSIEVGLAYQTGANNHKTPLDKIMNINL